MSIIHITRIEKKIKDEFEILLKKEYKDLSDESLLSRGQAALALVSLIQISTKEAVEAITDDYKDNGIDALYIDSDSKKIYLLQSKWISKGTSVPDKAGIIKFLQGVEDLINIRFERFNQKIGSKKEQIINALRDTSFRIEMIIVHTGVNKLSEETQNIIDDKLKTLNDTCELFYVNVLNQKDLYKCLLIGSDGSMIELESVSISNWGKHTEPFESIYGEIEAETIALWWQKHGISLLTKNIRKFKGNTSVNALIRLSLTNFPEDFWYYNNGITVLCKGISKSTAHGNDKNLGIFSFKEVSIVNGAQTFGTIGETFVTNPQQVKKAKVQVRFINLENAPNEYAIKITRFTNTQNRIENKDFAALDPNQERLREDLWLDGLKYTFKAGEPKPTPEEGFDLEDETIALACANEDIHLSILANRELGSIWLDIEKPPYTKLFNTKTESVKVKNSVNIYRRVETFLSKKSNSFTENDAHLAIHGNRFLLHIVFKTINQFEISKHDFNAEESISENNFNRIFDLTKEALSLKFKNPILYTLFKNQQKTIQLRDYIEQKLGLKKDLFS